MTIRHLRIFIIVHDEMNMTSAAHKLFMTQPSVSQAIKELESYYGVILFERLSRKLHVSPAGEKLYQYATHIIKLFDELEDNMKEDALKKQLTIGVNYTVGTVLIHKYIEQFHLLYPDSEIKIIVNKASVLTKMLRENQLDFALVEELKAETDLIQEIFYDDHIVIVAHSNHPIFSKTELSAFDISKEHLLLREKGAGVRDLFEAEMNRLGISIQPFWESTSTTALIRAVEHQTGIAILPWELVKEYIESGSLKELVVNEIALTRHLSIVYHKNKFLTSTMRDFMKICTNSLASETFGVC